jgi:hypothetical protein
MKLIAKINSEYLDQLLEGSKTMEFRQFNGSDEIELTDETGRTETLKIERADTIGEEFEKTVKERYKNIAWTSAPIIAFHIKGGKRDGTKSKRSNTSIQRRKVSKHSN